MCIYFITKILSTIEQNKFIWKRRLNMNSELLDVESQKWDFLYNFSKCIANNLVYYFIIWT